MTAHSNTRFTAEQLMTKPVETVSARDPLYLVARLFADRSISAAGVLDDKGSFVGVITKTDLIRNEDQRGGIVAALQATGTGIWSESGLPIVNEEDLVSHWMTPVIFSVSRVTSAAVLARRMVKYGTHHILVHGTRKDDIVGIVSSFDLLRVIAGDADAPER